MSTYIVLALIPVNTVFAVLFWRDTRWLSVVNAICAAIDIAVVALNLAVR